MGTGERGMEELLGVDVPAALLERLSVPGPRYTSYPTANVFDERFGASDFAAALARFGEGGGRLSLYLHVPFCRSLCLYCACNVVITRRSPEEYLGLVEREAELASAALGRRVPVTQLHLGGGTPTYLSPADLRRVHGSLAARFDLSALQEAAVEVDPRATTREQLETLAELGWNRASFGVQDFDPRVQEAIHREQSVEETRELVEAARALGFKGINVDLIYGLPFQRLETFQRTLDEVLALRPDRVALYAYAHVPWLRPAQASFDRRGFPRPAPAEKLALMRAAVRAFGAAGYRHLGMDHFALPSDELALARADGTLHRNFQGYTVRRAEGLLALGPSAISDLGGVYAQNARELPAWKAALEGGQLATVRGWRLSPEDEARREAILDVMTGRPIAPEFLRAHPEVGARLEVLAADGLIRFDAQGAPQVTLTGRFFLRNVAMAFDEYLGERQAERRFSSTV